MENIVTEIGLYLYNNFFDKIELSKKPHYIKLNNEECKTYITTIQPNTINISITNKLKNKSIENNTISQTKNFIDKYKPSTNEFWDVIYIQVEDK